MRSCQARSLTPHRGGILRPVITQLKLLHFKGFRNYTMSLRGSALLVGPNNAGKSTVISALRLGGSAARVAMRSRAQHAYRDGDRQVRGWPLSSATASGFVSENVRHEFKEEASRLELSFKGGAVLHLVWPLDDSAFFWVEHPKGMQVTTANRAKLALHHVGIVPTLTPLDHEERRLSSEHVKANQETRLASRHFRNQLRLVQDSDEDLFSDLIEFLLEHTPELATLELASSAREGGEWLDLYYTDAGSRIEKEIFWAGDGLQIWLQLLPDFRSW
jgi:hypothetical protein